jgi:chromate transporter
MTRSPLAELVVLFAPLSLMSVGGGQTVVSDIHRQVVDAAQWMSDGRFLELFAVSRMAPGPGALLASLVGWDVAGWAGAIVATLAFFLPSSLAFFFVARLWSRHRDATVLKIVEEGLAPVSAGLVLASAFVLIASTPGGVLAWIVAFGATLALATTTVSPLLLLAAGAAVFLVLA